MAWNPNVKGPPQKSAADPLHTLATHLATRYGKDGMQKHSLSYGKNDWLICKMYWVIDWLSVVLSLIQEYIRSPTIPKKSSQNVLRLDLWAGRDFYRALPALTRKIKEAQGEKQNFLSIYNIWRSKSEVNVWLKCVFLAFYSFLLSTPKKKPSRWHGEKVYMYASFDEGLWISSPCRDSLSKWVVTSFTKFDLSQ